MKHPAAELGGILAHFYKSFKFVYLNFGFVSPACAKPLRRRQGFRFSKFRG